MLGIEADSTLLETLLASLGTSLSRFNGLPSYELLTGLVATLLATALVAFHPKVCDGGS
jgi:hypothetical protein